MTFNEWLVALGKYREKHPGQRAGQAAFNFLQESNPDLARKVQDETNLDPFYAESNDAADRIRLKRFFSYIEEHWDD